MRKIILAVLLILIPSIARAQSPVVGASCPASGQTGITAAGVPVICTQPTGGGALVWTATGGGGGTSFTAGTTPVTNTIYVNDPKYGAKFNGKACFGNVNTITVTNTSNQVTCNVGNFTAVDSGKQFTASNGCCGVGANYQGTALFPFVAMHICKATDSGSGGIGVVNSTTINICKDSDGTVANATSSCSGATCIIAWATNDDAAISAAEVDWAAGNKCSSLALPNGITATLVSHFTNPGTNCLGAEPQADYTAAVYGQGIGSTIIGLFSGFNFTACTAGGVNACFGGYLENVFHDFQWNGFGIGNTGAPSAKVLIALGLGSQSSQFACNAFGGSDTNLTGVSTGLGARWWGMSIDGCGNTGLNVGANLNKAYYSFVGDTLGPNMVINGGDLTDYGSDYGGAGGTQIITLVGNARYHGIGSNLFGCGVANSTAINVGSNGGAGAILILDGARFNCTSTTSNGIYLNNAGQKAYLYGGTVVGGTSANILRSAGTVYMDNTVTIAGSGSNTSFTPTCTFTSGGGTSPSCAIQAGSTNEKGVIIATTGTGSPGSTGTITLTFAGTYTGPTGASPSCTYTPDDSGTAWGNGALARVSTQSTTAPIVAWSNSAANVLTALAVSSPFRIDYVCEAR